jgi:hypothetical protein
LILLSRRSGAQPQTLARAALERQHRGISKIERDADGVIVLNEE